MVQDNVDETTTKEKEKNIHKNKIHNKQTIVRIRSQRIVPVLGVVEYPIACDGVFAQPDDEPGVCEQAEEADGDADGPGFVVGLVED